MWWKKDSMSFSNVGERRPPAPWKKELTSLRGPSPVVSEAPVAAAAPGDVVLLPADCVELEPAAEGESEEDAEACVGSALAEELGWDSSGWDLSDEAPEVGEAEAAEGASSEDLPPPPRTPPRSPPSWLELVFCEPEPELSLGEAAGAGAVAEEASSEDLPPPPRAPPRSPPSWLELVFCEPEPEVSLGEAAGAAADEVGCESASSSGWF